MTNIQISAPKHKYHSGAKTFDTSNVVQHLKSRKTCDTQTISSILVK